MIELDYIVSDEGILKIGFEDQLIAVRGDYQANWGPRLPTGRVVSIAREARAFEIANWNFLHIQDAANVDPAEVTEIGRVYRYYDHVLIGMPELYVQLPEDWTAPVARAWLANQGFHVIRSSEAGDNLFVVATGDADPFDEAAALRQHPGVVEFAEPALLNVISKRVSLSDPNYSDAWHIPHIGVPLAWTHSKGANTRIVIIDQDFEAIHEDLAGGLTNKCATRETSGTWVNGLSAPVSTHGTAVAGVAGARSNGKGVMGVAPECGLTLLAIKMKGDLFADLNAIAAAIGRASKPSLKTSVICSSMWNSVSILTGPMKKALKKAARKARNRRGVPVFWAVNNGSTAPPLIFDQVAQSGRVIAVGRSNQDATAGPHAEGDGMELIAPGDGLHTTWPANATYPAGTYSASSSGTSFAAPVAAGVAALMIAANPKLRAKHVRLLLRYTADKIGPSGTYNSAGWSPKYGYGRVDAGSAVSIAAWLAGIGFPP